jgi:hypothetical protein
MLIGLSYSRCVKDIVEGRVNIDDVMVIIARTDFDPNVDTQWKGIWRGYAGGTPARSGRITGSYSEWYGTTDEDEVKYRNISVVLFASGKLHQPRQFVCPAASWIVILLQRMHGIVFK